MELVGEKNPAQVAPGSEVIEAIKTMQSNNFQELLVSSTEVGGRPLILSSYSIISKLLSVTPLGYDDFLHSACVESALSVGTITDQSDLISLLHVFESSSFSFAIVHDSQNKLCGKLSIKNLLNLYGLGFLSSNLRISDVQSEPVFSMSRGTKIVDCLRELEIRKIRKVQLVGTGSVISDKQLLSHIFNERRMVRISKSPQHLLDDTLEDLESVQTTRIDGHKSISEAAMTLIEKGADSFLTERGIVTPWDLIIKPWRMGELRVESS